MGGQWRYALHDLLTGAQLAEHVPFTLDSYTTMLGEPGTLTAKLPLGDANVQKLRPRELVLPRRTALVLFRDETPVWDGVIWTRRRVRKDHALLISAAEIRSYYAHRLLRPELGYGSAKTISYTQADLFDVFRAIFKDAQNIAYLGLQPGNLGVEIDDSQMSGILIDRRDAGNEQTAYHGYEFSNHAQLLDDLAGTDPGMEWRIDTYLGENRTLRRRLVLGSPKLGVPANASALATYEYPGQILDYEWPEDGESSANWVAALGDGEGDGLRWAQAYNDAEILAGYPLLEVASSYKDISSTTILAQKAAADLARLAGEVTVPGLDLAGYPDVELGDHSLARIADEEWWHGSSVTPFEATVRIIGKTVTPGPKERTTLIIEEPR